MTQYNSLSVKLSNLQLNKLKSGIQNGTQITLNLSSHVPGESDDETSFYHKLLLTNTQVSKIRETFANVSSANIKFLKTELPKIVHLRGERVEFLTALILLSVDSLYPFKRKI